MKNEVFFFWGTYVSQENESLGDAHGTIAWEGDSSVESYSAMTARIEQFMLDKASQENPDVPSGQIRFVIKSLTKLA